MGYILSDNIHAFPVASRGPGFPYSRITTEYNLTQNLRAFTTMAGFVVKPASSLGDDDIVSFVIHGYYFEATASDIKTASGIGDNGTIYASIKVSGDSNEKMELQSIEISASESQDPELYTQDALEENPSSTEDQEENPSPTDSQNTDESLQVSPSYIDVDTYFTGVVFSAVKQPGTGVYSIPIVDVTGGSMSIPDGYCYRLSSKDVGLIWQDLTATNA